MDRVTNELVNVLGAPLQCLHCDKILWERYPAHRPAQFCSTRCRVANHRNGSPCCCPGADHRRPVGHARVSAAQLRRARRAAGS